MKKYLVQTLYDDGSIACSMNTMPQIAELFGFCDCTDCDYRVFDVSEFGKALPIQHIGATSAPFNYHKFVDVNGEVVYEGYSKEH